MYAIWGNENRSLRNANVLFENKLVPTDGKIIGEANVLQLLIEETSEFYLVFTIKNLQMTNENANIFLPYDEANHSQNFWKHVVQKY